MVIESGPCTWVDADPLCCDDWANFSAEIKEQALDFAKTVLWAATGRQYGLCELTVRPCGRQCVDCAAGYYYDGEGGWFPYINSAGLWKNCWCGSGPLCNTCTPECQVYLPGPVYSVQQVRLGGEVLVSGGYFVLDQQWLVRVDTAECWPMCDSANLSLAPGDPNIFEVTYLRGRAVPGPLAQAAINYACEWAKACNGMECRLPGRVQSISRQGISINMVDINELLKANLTGIVEIDQLIAVYNPYGLKGRTRFYSPDLLEPRQVTWP